MFSFACLQLIIIIRWEFTPLLMQWVIFYNPFLKAAVFITQVKNNNGVLGFVGRCISEGFVRDGSCDYLSFFLATLLRLP